jgi:hypothetical protein
MIAVALKTLPDNAMFGNHAEKQVGNKQEKFDIYD